MSYRKSGNNNRGFKRREHTKNDRRYKRSNRVAMTDCPLCGDSNSLLEKNSGGYVWAECRTCNCSGYDERIQDNHLVENVDLVSTLIDANCQESSDEDLDSEEECNSEDDEDYNPNEDDDDY